MQELYSAKSRLQKIVDDILFDMATRDRLMSGHGNALLVSGGIFHIRDRRKGKFVDGKWIVG